MTVVRVVRGFGADFVAFDLTDTTTLQVPVFEPFSFVPETAHLVRVDDFTDIETVDPRGAVRSTEASTDFDVIVRPLRNVATSRRTDTV